MGLEGNRLKVSMTVEDLFREEPSCGWSRKPRRHGYKESNGGGLRDLAGLGLKKSSKYPFPTSAWGSQSHRVGGVFQGAPGAASADGKGKAPKSATAAIIKSKSIAHGGIGKAEVQFRGKTGMRASGVEVRWRGRKKHPKHPQTNFSWVGYKEKKRGRKVIIIKKKENA